MFIARSHMREFTLGPLSESHQSAQQYHNITHSDTATG